ncbi:MAG TPA: uroporphyrinogen decarboxylase family protein [Anaerolineales bacterium]|nr:uroporphyrinogen decarboxylase family protein [Anaerolineales bacterium]
METSRERILKCLAHVQPEVTPIFMMSVEDKQAWLTRFSAVDEVDLWLKLGLDLLTVRVPYTGKYAAQDLTIFGQPTDNTYGSLGAGYSKERGHFPLQGASSLAEIEAFPWPDPDEYDYEAAALALQNFPPDKAKGIKLQYSLHKPGQSREASARSSGIWLPILCNVMDLFGIEETMLNLHLQPELVEATIAHLEDFTLKFSRRALEATHKYVDTVHWGDDFSTQRGLMISATHWRKFLKPTYRKIFDLIKSYGLRCWFHSCGTFRPVLPDLIDMGMDVWETVQVQCPGNEPEVLKREYGQDITFYGAISTQTTLPYGSEAEVRAEVRERIRVLGKGGGYICGNDHLILIDAPMDNVLAMLDEARRFRWEA